MGSERGLGGGSEGWIQGPSSGGPGASACSPTYIGQPNSLPGTSGGDIDLAWGSAPLASGNYPLYVASLNGGSVAVSVSSDAGRTFRTTIAQAGLPGDDREWIAAYGSQQSLLSFHDANGNIEVLRSTTFGGTYVLAGLATTADNGIGNIVIDHNTGVAYQVFASNSSAVSAARNEVFVAVSNDVGTSWTARGIPCSISGGSLDHQFPNVSVSPGGALWASWSDDGNVFTATSPDRGASWSACTRVSVNTGRAVMPWLVAGATGVDLVYYGSPDGVTWYVYFVQDHGSGPGGWGTPAQLMPVHSGPICEDGVACTSGRQLLDDFGVDVDPQGFAHIAYSHDSPDLDGAQTYTGYAVQVGGVAIGPPN
ncbi:MAG: hypothetical protein ABR573_06855 [Candidatus Dormibacteria bacterium]